MESDWVETTLGAEVDFLTGFPFKSTSYTNNPTAIKLLRGDNIVQGSLRWDGVKAWPAADRAQYANYELQADDVVLAMDRPWIEAGLKYAAISKHDLPCLLVQRTSRLRGGPRIDTRFLKYLIGSREFTEHVLAMQTGTAVPHISGNQIRDFKFRRPPLAHQRATVRILGTFDDKIELNRRMNGTLEGMARALFQSWLSDAPPLRINASKLISDGVLEIGDGYRAKNSELGTEGVPFVRAGNLGNGFDLDGADRLLPGRVAMAASKLSMPGDVAFTSKGTVGRIARVDKGLTQFVYAPQVCYWRSRNADRLSPAVLYCWMVSSDFGNQLQSRAGQTDMAPYIFLKDQRTLTLPDFPESQATVGEKLQPLLDMKAMLQAESRTLSSVRDALLPKLLSGELAVGEIAAVHDIPDVRSVAAEPSLQDGIRSYAVGPFFTRKLDLRSR